MKMNIVFLGLMSMVAFSNAISVSMMVYFDVSGLCPTVTPNGTIPPQTLSINALSGTYNPSCSEFMSFVNQLPSDTYVKPTLASCVSANAAPSVFKWIQSVGLFDGTMGTGTPSSNYYYGTFRNVTSFRVLSCTESAATVKGYLPPKDVTFQAMDDCFYIPSKTNDTTTLDGLQSFTTLSMSFPSLTARTKSTTDFTYEFITSSSLSSAGGNTWSLDQTLSNMAQFITVNGSQVLQNIFNPSQTYTFTYTYSGSDQYIKYVAPTIKVLLGTDGKTFTATLERNLTDTPIPMQKSSSCVLTYNVGVASGARLWGEWMTPATFDDMSSASLSISGVGIETLNDATEKGYGYDVAFKIQDGGCLEICMQSVTIYQPSTKYNPNYSPQFLAPGQENSRCVSGSASSSVCTSPYVVSDYTGSQCLCGVMSSFSFPSDQNEFDLKGYNTLTALYNPYYINYTVGSGGAYGATSESEEAEQVASIAGGTVGGIIVAVIVIVLFFVFSKVMGDKSKQMGDSLVEKTTTPLAGVQMALIFGASACALISCISSNGVTVLMPSTANTVNTFNMGIFMTTTTDGRVGTLTGSTSSFVTGGFSNNEAYSCYLLLQDIDSVSGADYDYGYVNSCNAVRGCAVLSVLCGAIALGVAFFHRQRLVIPLMVVGTLSSVIGIAVFKTQIVDGWINSVNQPTSTYMLGSGFNIMIAAVFFFIVQLIGSFIELGSMEALE